MRVVHEPSDERDRDGGAVDEPTTGERVLATRVETADAVLEQARGLMFRSELPDDYALVFRFPQSSRWIPDPLTDWRSVHMLFVRLPLDVLWLRDGAVTQAKTLSPWTGVGLGRADTLVELPAGAAEDVAVGDAVWIEDGGGDR